MNKLLVVGVIGGLAWYFLLRPKAVVPPVVPQQNKLTVEPNPQQMQTSPGMSAFNEDIYPIGTFAQ